MFDTLTTPPDDNKAREAWGIALRVALVLGVVAVVLWARGHQFPGAVALLVSLSVATIALVRRSELRPQPRHRVK